MKQKKQKSNMESLLGVIHRFDYIVHLSSGETVEGRLEAESQHEVVKMLKDKYHVKKKDIELTLSLGIDMSQELHTYKYTLFDELNAEPVIGYIESRNPEECVEKLRMKYTFNEEEFTLVQEHTFTLHDLFSSNREFQDILQDQTELISIKDLHKQRLTEAFQQEAGIKIEQEETINTLQRPAADVLLEQYQKFREALQKSGASLHDFMEQKKQEREILDTLSLDYRKIIKVEKELQKEMEKEKEKELDGICNVLQNRFLDLEKTLEDFQLKVALGKLELKDQKSMNQLETKIFNFQDRLIEIDEILQEEYGVVPAVVQKVARLSQSLQTNLEQTKIGNIPSFIQEKAQTMIENNQKAKAQKIADAVNKLKVRLQKLYDVHDDIKNPEERAAWTEKYEFIMKKLAEFTTHNLVLKYHPQLADPNMVETYEKYLAGKISQGQFESERIEYLQKLGQDKLADMKKKEFEDKNKLDEDFLPKKRRFFSLAEFLEKFNLKNKVDIFKNEFMGGGLTKFFNAMRDRMLGRKKIDIHGKEEKEGADIKLTPEQKMLRSKFKFYLTPEQMMKKNAEAIKVLEGAKETGSFWKDLGDFINDFLIDISSIKTKELAIFYRILAVMVSAGIPLIKALYQMIDQTDNLKMKKVIYGLSRSIEQGASLSLSMRMYPDVFDEAIIGMIKSGELSGNLPEILRQVADMVEKSNAMSSKVKGALMYPMVLIVVLVGVVIAIMTLVIPKLMPLFANGGLELPWTTKLLIACSEFFQHRWYIAVGAVFIASTAFKWYTGTYTGKFQWDFIKLRIPIFGILIQKTCLARFSRTMASLTSSGLSIIKSLKINAESVGNEVYKLQILQVAEGVKLGNGIAETLQGNKLFPTMLVSMIQVGEDSASLATVTNKVASFYEQEVDDMVKNLSTLMEPVIIVTLAVVVGFIMVAIMQPLLDLTSNIK